MIQFCLDKMRRFDGTLANHGMDVCVLTLILAVENKCTEARWKRSDWARLHARYRICPATAEPLSEDLALTGGNRC